MSRKEPERDAVSSWLEQLESLPDPADREAEAGDGREGPEAEDGREGPEAGARLRGALPGKIEERRPGGRRSSAIPFRYSAADWADGGSSDLGVERLREQAVRMAREDAAAGVPATEAASPTRSEENLWEQCRAYFDRWRSRERQRFHTRLAEAEERISDKLEGASLAVDRFERLTNELVRLKARLSVKRREVTSDLGAERSGRMRGIPTKIYVVAISFLGVVEFFANAPVFSALMPRDPLTERQIRLVSETSEGWLAGAERVFAHLILRPDAALLALGVVTFLVVLCHFFGHSLREFVIQRDRSAKHTVQARSQMENVVPMVLTGLGLVLVLGVLYEARITLGDVGEEQYAQDITVVEEFRRQAGWLRADGDLLAANEMTNRADDMEGAAHELREYAASMSRLSFPILLLNLTLVLCAISAAYFHRRDARREQFNETPFEEERRAFIESAESAAQEVAAFLSELTRHIRELKNLTFGRPEDEAPAMAHQLESVIALYRAENGRARGLDPGSVPAFAQPVSMNEYRDGAGDEAVKPLRPPEDYERERQAVKARFDEVRKRFNEEAMSW